MTNLAEFYIYLLNKGYPTTEETLHQAEIMSGETERGNENGTREQRAEYLNLS